MRRTTWLLALVLGLPLASEPAAAGDHVRVVLDVSGSLVKNDPQRRVILATLLLHDLTAPNSRLDDSFEILPFDSGWNWPNPQDPPPKANRPRIRAELDRRDELVAALARQTYDSGKTYFYPGLKAAIEDLRQTPGGAYDVRTIVLVTDGVPEPPTRDREAELIRGELVPQLEAHGIRLYVLAFSAEAEKHRDFLEAMVRGPGGRQLGEVFLDPQGDRLLAHMLELFARSFGYTVDAARELPGVDRLDLEGGRTPERVAVVVHSPLLTPPSLALSPPPGGSLNAPVGQVSGSEQGGSYALRWSFSPDEGEYAFATNAVQGTVAVLRPTRLELEVLPAPPRQHADLAMAERPFPLRILVKSPNGGDPGPVELTFRPLGERTGAGDLAEDHRWVGDRGAPAAGPGTVTPEGRVYDVTPQFERNTANPGQLYVGHLEVEARHGEAVVGSLVRQHAHRLEVHPLLALAPLPLTAYVADSALGRNEKSCTHFSLTLAAGELPHPDRPEYALRAELAASDPGVLGRELRGAFFTLDGLPLAVAGQPQPEPGPWAKGRTLPRRELLGGHEVCVQTGKPVAAKPETLALALRFTLVESPYDDFEVVDLFTLKVPIAPSRPLDRWREVFLLASALLALLALLWYLRDRPGLPRDLGYALGRDGAALVPRPLAEGAFLRRLLALVSERPLVAAGEEETLAWLRPAGEELYRVRPAPGVRISDENGRAVPAERGQMTLETRRPYQLTSERGRFILRLEYL